MFVSIILKQINFVKHFFCLSLLSNLLPFTHTHTHTHTHAHTHKENDFSHVVKRATNGVGQSNHTVLYAHLNILWLFAVHHLMSECLFLQLENERQWKEDSDRLHRDEVGKLESQLAKEKDSNRTIKANLEEEKRQLDGWLKEERRRVNALESRLSNDSKHKEVLQAQLEMKENNTWVRME